MQMSSATNLDMSRFQRFVEQGTPAAMVFRPAGNEPGYATASATTQRVTWEDRIAPEDVPY